MDVSKQTEQLCLAIGNSRLHWAWFTAQKLQLSWHTPHLTEAVVNDLIPAYLFPDPVLVNWLSQLPVCLISVVPTQTILWQNYTPLHQITLADIPLQGIYSTMGIDRALVAWGAGTIYGFPCLVIDAGTALTFTGVDDQQQLMGGAILPGLGLQLKSLAAHTSALPTVNLEPSLPNRWALDTDTAISSGVVYSVLASLNSFIVDWTQQFPHSQVVVTGGDTLLLEQYWEQYLSKTNNKVIFNSNLLVYSINLLC